MPQRTKKEHKCSHHTAGGSRWHNFHFSGKVIVCSVILGFMLVLIGGILMAIDMDNDDEKKSDDYDDLQKKPPMVFVGPAIMGIGGFAVVVGVLMCLFETKVCRKKNPDANPLINGDGDQTEIRDGTVRESDPTAVPSTSRHHHDKHRNGAHKKSPSPRKSKTKRPHSNNQNIQIKAATQLSHPADGGNFSTDKFLTPPNSFADDVPVFPEKMREKENQVKAALMQSLTSSGKSWNTSTEFQTPSASYIDDPVFLQSMDRREEQIVNHKFLTPMNSDAGIIDEEESEELESESQTNEVPAPQETNLEKTTSIEVSVQVHQIEDDGKESSQPDASPDVLVKKDSSTEQKKPIEQNQILDTIKEALPNESAPDAASCEENENSENNYAHGTDEQINNNIEENTCNNIKDESIIVNVEVSSTDIGDSKTDSDGTHSVDAHEAASQLNSVVVDSSNDDIGNISPEIDSTSKEVDASLESVDTLT